MRDVEELLDNPELRAEAARIRDRARGAREEFKRHAKVPDWNQVERVSWPNRSTSFATGSPKRSAVVESPDALVPIDRDPVPPSLPKACAAITNDWGAVDDDAVPDLGITPLDDRRDGAHGRRGGRDPVELCPRGTKRSVKIAAATLKALGFTALAISLLDPLLTGTRPRRGANAFVILADNSQSLGIRDDNATGTRGDWLRDVLRQESPWRTRLGQDFDVRGYVFDTHLRAVDGFDALTFDGTGTSLTASLSRSPSDSAACPWPACFFSPMATGPTWVTSTGRRCRRFIPWYRRRAESAKDVGVSQISISQTNFESAPAVIRADVLAVGFKGKPIVAVVADETGKEVERQQMLATGDGKPLSFRFQFRPEQKGVNFYQVHAFAASDEKKPEQVAAHRAASRASRRSPTTAGWLSSIKGVGPTGCST